MIFVSEEVELKYEHIESFCKKYNIEIYDHINELDDVEDDITLDNNTMLMILLPEAEDYEELVSLENFYTIITAAINSSIIDEYKLISPNLVLISVRCDNPKVYDPKLLEYIIDQEWNGKNIRIKFVRELSSFGIKLTIDKLFTRYVPPVSSEDLFIEITSEEIIEPEVVDDIVQSFIFECTSSLNLNIYLYPRPTNFELYLDHIEEDPFPNLGLRNLLQGRGIVDVLKIYNSCNQIYDAEYLILTYTKVIEFVSQTVLRKEMLESITKKLYSNKTLNPDANYILELERLFSEHRNNQKDSYAIKLTIETCCDILEIVSLAPKYLTQIKKLTSSSSKEHQIKCFGELSSAVSDTRNMLAHAKTNYNRKGLECPEDQLSELAACLKIVAHQTIRWFSRQHEDSRII